MTITEEKIKNVFEGLKGVFGWKNRMQSPRIEKIAISTGIGRVRTDKVRVDLIEDRLKKITGQKPIRRKAHTSIASFKLREGEVVGLSATLRGKRMYEFLDRFINLAIPRMRDFRGISRTSVDEMGNLSIGIPEHTIFPETPDENIQDVFGLSITIVTSSKGVKEATTFLEKIGVPFVREKSE